MPFQDQRQPNADAVRADGEGERDAGQDEDALAARS
jgi:hypothetical protein